MSKKIKVLTISDMPLANTGVGLQTRFFIEGLLDSGKFEVISMGGAKKHNTMRPVQVQNGWKVIPVKDFGDQNIVRSILNTEKPDILWFMTDPRFYGWLWMMEHEIRKHVPMVYYHVWDNYPVPYYNEPWYLSNDAIISISKVTADIVQKVTPNIYQHYHPHAVNPAFFKKMSREEVQPFVDKFPEGMLKEDTFKFFYNSKNFGRKMTGSIIMWFNSFLNEVGRDKAQLIMHTDPKAPYGQNLEEILKLYNLTNGEVLLNNEMLDFVDLATLYNIADCTVQLSDAEGFGLSVQESLACGTIVVGTETGGITEQIRTNDGTELGALVKPYAKALHGSQDIYYIYQDRVAEKDVIKAFKKVFNMTPKERNELGQKAIEHVRKNFNFSGYRQGWVQIMTDIHEKFGSWENRKGYKSYKLHEVK